MCHLATSNVEPGHLRAPDGRPVQYGRSSAASRGRLLTLASNTGNNVTPTQLQSLATHANMGSQHTREIVTVQHCQHAITKINLSRFGNADPTQIDVQVVCRTRTQTHCIFSFATSGWYEACMVLQVLGLMWALQLSMIYDSPLGW